MEKLKNENSKKIEIKIIGDNCIVSFPSSKNPSKKDVPTFPLLENEFKSTIDLNLSLSSNSEDDFISNLKEIKKKNKELESNSKKKLEITNKSIFYSESNIKLSSSDRDKNIDKNKKIKDNKNKENILKNSVIKKLNFDLCDTIKILDKNKKLSESDRAKNKSNFLYKNKNLINNCNYNINNILIDNKNKNQNQNNGMKKRTNSMMNYEPHIIKEELNKINSNINHSFIRHKQNNSFVLPNPFNNNKIIYFNNNNNNAYEKGNLTINKRKFKPEIKFPINKKKYTSPKLFNKKRNIKNNLDKLVDEKSLIKVHNFKFKSTLNFSSSKKDNNKSNLSKKNNSKTITNNKIKEIKNSKIINKKFSNTKKSINTNNNKKNMFCIKKPNKKIVPYLTSTIINNNVKNEKNMNINNKKNEYCSLKQYYYLKSPYLLNTQATSSTPITSTNGCTNGTNCTNSSTINSPSNNTSKKYFKSNIDDKNILMKYHSQNSFLKNIVHNNNNLNHNNHINENKNNKILHNNKISKNKIDLNKNKNKNININKIIKNNTNFSYKKPDNIKYLKKSKISDINNQKLINKCNTNELKNIIKSNIKTLHKILTERNFSEICSSNSFNNIKNNLYENNVNIINKIV